MHFDEKPFTSQSKMKLERLKGFKYFAPLFPDFKRRHSSQGVKRTTKRSQACALYWFMGAGSVCRIHWKTWSGRKTVWWQHARHSAGKVPRLRPEKHVSRINNIHSSQGLLTLTAGQVWFNVRGALKPGNRDRGSSVDFIVRNGMERERGRGTVSYTHLRAHETG